MRQVRYFGPIKREHIFLIQQWRNEQMDILRQKKKIKRSEQISWFNSLKKDKNQKLFAIFEKTNVGNIFIGYCGLTHIDYFNRKAEVSFVVNPRRVRVNRIYETDMLNALFFLARYGFRRLKLKRVFTETYAFRKKHIKILEQFGFKKEGILRACVFLRNRYYNSLMHSMLREEFLKKFRRG